MTNGPQGFTDQLNIDTPEQVELRFPIAGIGSRFLAVLTDSVIQIVAEIVLLLLFVLVVSAAQRSALGQMSDTTAKWFVAGVLLFHFLLYWGYFALFEAFWNGQTPGKRLMKIRVIKDSGRQITFFEALARNLLRIVDLLFGYLVGVICMLCNKQQKRLGDFVAGTIVVHERSEDQPSMTHTSRTFTAAMYAQPTVLETPRRNESVALAADAVGPVADAGSACDRRVSDTGARPGDVDARWDGAEDRGADCGKDADSAAAGSESGAVSRSRGVRDESGGQAVTVWAGPPQMPLIFFCLSEP